MTPPLRTCRALCRSLITIIFTLAATVATLRGRLFFCFASLDIDAPVTRRAFALMDVYATHMLDADVYAMRHAVAPC